MTAPIMRPLLEDIQQRISTLELFVAQLVKDQLRWTEERERLRADLRKAADHAQRLVAQKEALLAAIGRTALDKETPTLREVVPVSKRADCVFCKCQHCGTWQELFRTYTYPWYCSTCYQINRAPNANVENTHSGPHEWYTSAVNRDIKIWRCARQPCKAGYITSALTNEKPPP